MKIQTWNKEAGLEPAAPPRRRRGFTFVEVMVGMAVLGILTVGLYSGMTYGYKSIQVNQENLRATQIILEKLEVIRAFTWQHLVGTQDPDMTDDDEDAEKFDITDPDDPVLDDEPAFYVPKTFTATYNPGNTNKPGFIYNGTVTIQPGAVSEAYSNSMLSVKIDLTWNSGSGTRTRSFRTSFAEYGLQNSLKR